MTVRSNAGDAPMARILVSGDQSLMRAALSRLIEAELGIVVIGDCDNEAASLSRQACARPDLVVMDIDFQKHCCGDQERIGKLFGATGGAPVVVVTTRENTRCLNCAMQHGASGLVMKDRPASTLTRAIQATLSGEIWMERSMMPGVLRGEPQNDATAEAEQLTAREREIVELVGLGLPNKRIAERLFISATTVRHHLTSIFGKLRVSSRCELMSYVFHGRRDGDGDGDLAAADRN